VTDRTEDGPTRKTDGGLENDERPVRLVRMIGTYRTRPDAGMNS